MPKQALISFLALQVRELTGDMNLTKSEIEATQVRTSALPPDKYWGEGLTPHSNVNSSP